MCLSRGDRRGRGFAERAVILSRTPKRDLRQDDEDSTLCCEIKVRCCSVLPGLTIPRRAQQSQTLGSLST